MTLPTRIQELIDDGPVLLDGAWGAQLQAGFEEQAAALAEGGAAALVIETMADPGEITPAAVEPPPITQSLDSRRIAPSDRLRHFRSRP
jgi:methionine synthase I (cobalamin-dependent)